MDMSIDRETDVEEDLEGDEGEESKHDCHSNQVPLNFSEIMCDNSPKSSGSSSSSKSSNDFPVSAECNRIFPAPETPCQLHSTCSPLISSSSSSSFVLLDFLKSEMQPSDKVMHENAYKSAICKSILKKQSIMSGENLFDHLTNVINRVIDERPSNVIDFFEEYSSKVRDQKFHSPENLLPDNATNENRVFFMAKELLASIRLPKPLPLSLETEVDSEELQEELTTKSELELNLRLEPNDVDRIFITFNERVQQLQFYWNQCGFSISSDDIFQLAMSMTRLQNHNSIMQCRFWGVLSGVNAVYYVVEASLTRDEINTRNEQLDLDKNKKFKQLAAKSKDFVCMPNSDKNLIPGAIGWENWPQHEVRKMSKAAVPVPMPKKDSDFECPSENVGEGLNRYSYFVINKFSDDWIELPTITPKQIVASRHMKKFLTGNLEAPIISIPCFPGQEKHYLRAMISRITAGTYIAPEWSYRKMTKKEYRLYLGLEDDEMEEEQEEEEEEEDDSLMGEDDMLGNDITLLKNERYEPLPLSEMASLARWVHVRPNILNQGRVMWINEEKAREEYEKELERHRKMLEMEENYEEEEDNMGEEENEEEEDDDYVKPEVGPPILHPIDNDVSAEGTIPWVARYTSRFINSKERMLIMRSNVWPGAFTFIFGKVCESIYMGFGHKYLSRNMAFKHMPPIVADYPHKRSDFIETNDPTAAEEAAYLLMLLKKQKVQGEDEPEELEEEPLGSSSEVYE